MERNAKRRIQPTVVTTPESPSSGIKRKIEETDGIPFIKSVTCTDQDEGRNGKSQDFNRITRIKRRKNQSDRDRKVDPNVLDPFLFLITEPPMATAHGYKVIGDLISLIANHDKHAGDHPLTEDLTNNPNFTKEQREYWANLTAALNDPERFDANHTKFSFVNKILCLHAEEEWNKENMGFCKLYGEIWWVKMFRKFFEKTSSGTGMEDFIQMGMAALAAELFYRFVWARHTIHVYNYLNEKYKDYTTVHANEEHMSDDVVDQEDLGEGSSESSSEASDVSGIESDWEEEEGDDKDEKMDDEDTTEPATSKNTHVESAIKERLAKGHNDPILHYWPEEIENFDQEGVEDFDDMVEAAALFFTHPNITMAIDDLESVFLGNEAPWNIEQAIEAFVKLIEYKNRSSKSKTALSKSQIRGHVLHLYKHAFVPIIERLGIQTSGDNSYVWKWHPEFCIEYVDHVYIPAFRSLTQDGSIPHTQTFLTLFPKLFMLHDNTTDRSLHQVYSRIKSRLEYKGELTSELDNLLSMMDELTEERRGIIQKNKDDGIEDDDANVECDDEEEEERRLAERLKRKAEKENNKSDVSSDFARLMKQKLIATRNNRLIELDEMINNLQVEINRLTGDADKAVPKKRRSKKEPVITTDELMSNNDKEMNNLNLQ